MPEPTRPSPLSFRDWKLIALAGGLVLMGALFVANLAAESEAPGRVAGLGALAIGGSVLVLVGGVLISARRTMLAVTMALQSFERGESPSKLEVEPDSTRGDLAAAANHAARSMSARLERFARDDSERETILSGMAEGIIGTDGESRVVLVNAAARGMLLSGDLNPVGRPILELSRVPEVARSVQRCLAEGVIIRTETTITGSELDRVLQLDARPLADEVRGRWGCVLVVRDLSELRRLEEVRRDFVANVSHELKTPLTSMRAHLETVLDDPDMPQTVRENFLDKALTNTHRLAAIVTDLLSIARFESGSVSMEMERLELLKVVENSVRDARSSAERRRVAIELGPLPGALPVHGNFEALRMAVSNLLENAIKYSDENGEVALTLQSLEGRAILAIRDHGPGIPAGEQERIFERFYRVDKNRSRDLGGTGLGLSIVRNVMRRHGGEVKVKSQVGHGSTFSLEIPLAV